PCIFDTPALTELSKENDNESRRPCHRRSDHACESCRVKRRPRACPPSRRRLYAVGQPSGGRRSRDEGNRHRGDKRTNFHLLDFVAWNNRDMDVFRRLHTADVKVELGDRKTEGIEAHIAGVQPPTPATPDRRIVQHSPIVADGDWTCVVGISLRNDKLVTVAKWRDGAISEEYI